MAFEFVSKIKKGFSRQPKSFNHGYSVGNRDIGKFSYDEEALAVRVFVVQAYKDFFAYHYKHVPACSRREELAKRFAEDEITRLVDPIAKEVEEAKVSATYFYEAIAEMYKKKGLNFNRLQSSYSEPEIMDTKL